MTNDEKLVMIQTIINESYTDDADYNVVESCLDRIQKVLDEESVPIHIEIDGENSGSHEVETDNRDLYGTEVHYKDYPNVTFRISIEFCLELIQNAFENAKE